MLDFTSVLYLGMHHGHAALRPWWQITTGRPAALGSTTRVAGLETALAALMGHESAALGSSTLHLFWDLFAELVREPAAIHVDAGTYPIARWGVERVAARGVTVTVFPMHDTAAVRARLAREPGRYRPIVVCDGLCPLTGRLAPLRDYAEACAAVDGVLVVDDTQGLGLLGRRPNRAVPYGEDGAGTPAWWGVDGAEIIVVNSLAKAFGVPLAVIAGRAAQIERFKTNSLTRIHCSPPSLAGISAAEHALALNAAEGAGRRRRLLSLIELFRRSLRHLGLAAHGGRLPFQTLKCPVGQGAIQLHDMLLHRGIRAVLHRAMGRTALVTFVLNCLHSAQDIAAVMDALARARGRIPELRQAS